jgi:ATP synthase F1 delta subunit
MLTLDQVDQETRVEWMRNIFGNDVSKETLVAFCLMLDTQGQDFTDVLAKGLSILGSENRSVQGVVYSVVPIGKDEVKRLETQTSILLKKPVLLTNLIDESLIGGFLISVDGKMIDASIKKKIEDMSLRIKANTEGGNLL